MSTMALAVQDIPSQWMKMNKKPSSAAEETATASSSQKGASTTTLETQTSQTSAQSQPQLQSSASAGSSGAKPSQPAKPDFDMGAALGASLETGKGVGRIVETGMKTPMNFCMGLAKGFRNAPKLYNDQTVRKQEKVTDLASGVMVAGKEFGLGLFDGITGLVTQPLQGAEKDGARGLIKGFGKGLGGIVLKPAAGESFRHVLRPSRGRCQPACESDQSLTCHSQVHGVFQPT